MIKKLAGYIGRYKRAVALVPIFVLLDVVCELSMPLLMSKIIDVGIAGIDGGLDALEHLVCLFLEFAFVHL